MYFWNQHHLITDGTDLKLFAGRGWMIVQESPINFQRQDKSGLWHTALQVKAPRFTVILNTVKIQHIIKTFTVVQALHVYNPVDYSAYTVK